MYVHLPNHEDFLTLVTRLSHFGGVHEDFLKKASYWSPARVGTSGSHRCRAGECDRVTPLFLLLLLAKLSLVRRNVRVE
jgi:hypothetical protein